MTHQPTITDEIKKCIKDSIQAQFEIAYEESLKLDAPPNKKMGDFAFACFPLAKVLRQAPVQIAQQLAAGIAPTGIIEEVQPTGPYLNFFVNYEKLSKIVCTQIFDKSKIYGHQEQASGERVLVEYSAPNTNKPQHLGHIRNNLLGMAVTNLLKANGHEAIPVNLVNDRGVHICKSMVAYQAFGEGKTPASEGVKGDHFVGDYYVRYDKEEKKEWKEWIQARSIDLDQLEPLERRKVDGEFLKESAWYQKAQQMLRKWEAAEPEIRTLWEKMNGWVYEGFDRTYSRLGCRFEKVYHESETYELGKALVKQGLEQGCFYQKEDGSVWVDLSEEGLDQKLLLRRDGTSVYITQDIGTTKLKFDDFKMQRAIWVVADEQNYHFQVLFHVLKKLGFTWAEGCFHLSYGMIDLPEGKMKSREGTVVDADHLMAALFEMEKAEIQAREIPMSEADFERTAEILAQGALKFFILKFSPQSRMTFNPKESISPLGFTGPYIQYAFVRVRSLFRKASEYDFESLSIEDCDWSVLGNDAEKAIIRKLYDFPQEIQIAARTYNPARLCIYIFELAKNLNSFYHDHSILKAETPALVQARLVLSKAVAIVLQQGLGLLGIDVPERM